MINTTKQLLQPASEYDVDDLRPFIAAIYCYIIKDEILLRKLKKWLLDRSLSPEDIIHEQFTYFWQRPTIQKQLLKQYKEGGIERLMKYLIKCHRNKAFRVNKKSIPFGFNFSKRTYSFSISTSLLLEDIEKMLTPRQFEVFILRYEQKYKYKEVAEELEIVERTAKKHYYLALKKIKEWIQNGPNNQI